MNWGFMTVQRNERSKFQQQMHHSTQLDNRPAVREKEEELDTEEGIENSLITRAYS